MYVNLFGVVYRTSFITSYSVTNTIKKLNLNASHLKVKTLIESVTDEKRQKMSLKRKAWIKNNPDKHAWSNKKEASRPEIIFKKALTDLGLSVVEQYIPIESDRCFQIDFAIVGKKIGFETNGNQHYERGKLKSYYQERHDYLNSLGWVIHEIQYYECTNLDRAKNVISKCLENETIEYSTDPKIINYNDERKLQKIYDEESKIIFNENLEMILLRNKIDIMFSEDDFTIFNGLNHNCLSKEYLSLSKIQYRKVKRPEKEELKKLVWQKTSKKIAEDYGVSGKAIESWCFKYGIPKPPRGYWLTSKENQEAIYNKMHTSIKDLI